MKKFLYYITIVPPIWDLFVGTVKGLATIIELGKQMHDNKDIERFINDNK